MSTDDLSALEARLGFDHEPTYRRRWWRLGEDPHRWEVDCSCGSSIFGSRAFWRFQVARAYGTHLDTP